MTPFTTLTATAAPMLDPAIDTDLIFPARFLVLMQRQGLGRYFFHDRRFGPDGMERPEFVLNLPRFRNARILVAGPDFGCGSSREQAVWALADFGIRAVIAPSFGEIFTANCIGNGVLPARLDAGSVERLAEIIGDGSPVTVDLAACRITAAGFEAAFEIAPDHRAMLLAGTDAVDRILADAPVITAFEQARAMACPWLEPEWQGLCP